MAAFHQSARLICRVTVGALFFAHGMQKLTGWFGGAGLKGTEQMMAGMGLEPPKANAIAAGVSEAAGGALVALGAATPLASSCLIGVMTTAVDKAHLKQGLWSYKGGYEYNLVLIAMLAALAEEGPGKVSVDHLLGVRWRGTRWAAAAVALGVGTSLAVSALDKVVAHGRHTAGGPSDSSAETNAGAVS